jgi:hypothetical protein
VGGAVAAGGLAAIGYALYTGTKRASPRAAEPDPHASVMLGGLAVLAAALTILVGRDFLVTMPDDVAGQARLYHLFIYNYDRPWPESQQFTAALGAFVIVAALLLLAMAVRAWRAPASALFVCLGVLWSTWGVNAYFTIGAQHWGQRETILEYYRRRSNPDELLVAYQLNWKGENFYTGNRLPAFVSDPKGFKKWIAEHKEGRTRVMFFTTEHKRMDALERALGKVQQFEVITTKELCNKFALARVVF